MTRMSAGVSEGVQPKRMNTEVLQRNTCFISSALLTLFTPDHLCVVNGVWNRREGLASAGRLTPVTGII